MVYSKSDISYLQAMQRFALDIQVFMKPVDYAVFIKDNNKEFRSAIERLLLIVEHHANHISMEFQISHSEIEWVQIFGWREILALEYNNIEHGYGKDKMDIIYFAATKQIPPLLEKLTSPAC